MIHTLAFSANSEEILTTSAEDPIAKLWTTATGEQVQVLFSGDAQFTRAQFSRDGRYLAAGRRDGTVRLYPLQVQELVRVAKERLIQRPYTAEECRINLKQACPSLQ
jgi:WD40 repeat protein